MKAVTAAFVSTSLALSLATGNLPALLGAGLWSGFVYVYTKKSGLRRIRNSMTEENTLLEREKILLDYFKDKKNYLEQTGPWQDETAVEELKTIFDGSIPNWIELIEKSKVVDAELNKILSSATRNTGANELCARLYGIAAFVAPASGVVSIGYNIFKTLKNKDTESKTEKGKDTQSKTEKDTYTKSEPLHDWDDTEPDSEPTIRV